MDVGSLGAGGGCMFLLQDKAMTPVAWHRVAQRIAVSILEYLVHYSSLRQNYTIMIL